ncbi:hypothetical protein BSR29_04760 [Boudabousia liubingyangii]|uniref:Preprotein translocase subunit YajC n=2 Tax=Boudabousia liubingyangii TaxID=1921764 RepID=A0A1Q5PNV3_9ACTO|nr:hypothetical protein BSR28_04325 [Boudabousia liubingyangii]OKL49197.1 hypothetical protein BSR29_04760 [Boudabousia liubingyangii]
MLITIGVFFVAMLVLSSKGAKRQRAAMEAEREKALQLGNWVITTSGFYGKIVDLDGDVVTLATPMGDETYWNKRFIVRAEELPLSVLEGTLEEPEEELEIVDEVVNDEDPQNS